MYSDYSIRRRMLQGDLKIEPLGDKAVQPASVDVRLDNTFTYVKQEVIDYYNDNPDCTLTMEEIIKDPSSWETETFTGEDPNEHLLVSPGGFVIASTLEKVTIPDDLACEYTGKSSWARKGVVTHLTAGFIDPGFRGQVTLEIANHAPLPIKLIPGQYVGQLKFYDLTHPAMNPYGSKNLNSRYQDQTGATLSRNPNGLS